MIQCKSIQQNDSFRGPIRSRISHQNRSSDRRATLLALPVTECVSEPCCVCVCVYEKKRERETERACVHAYV